MGVNVREDGRDIQGSTFSVDMWQQFAPADSLTLFEGLKASVEAPAASPFSFFLPSFLSSNNNRGLEHTAACYTQGAQRTLTGLDVRHSFYLFFTND